MSDDEDIEDVASALLSPSKQPQLGASSSPRFFDEDEDDDGVLEMEDDDSVFDEGDEIQLDEIEEYLASTAQNVS